MSDIAIKIEHLSKEYLIGASQSGSLREKLTHIFSSGNKNTEIFHALSDISFEIKKGETIGIIGRNGAGKSTLLKILSKITSPSSGQVEINGRVSSLLEVGTGFHPELTGRENIFLNGTILGMTRKEVKAKFNEIVDFSGVEKFLDTPVKRYSSGMYVRLAFAVAAHLEPEILIIDEVLAVGDFEFQQKCLGKMKDVAKEGRTVIFVSHDLVAVEKLCDKAVLLQDGKMIKQGLTSDIIDAYLSYNTTKDMPLSSVSEREGNGDIKFVDGYWKNENSSTKNTVKAFQKCELHLTLNKAIDFKETKIDIGINDSKQNRIAWISSSLTNQSTDKTNSITFIINQFNIAPGNYTCNLFCETNSEVNDWLQLVLPFNVASLDYYNVGKTIPEKQGVILLDYNIK